MAEQPSDLLSLLSGRLMLAKRFKKTWEEDVKKWERDYNIQTILEAKIEADNLMQIPYIFSTIESALPIIFERIPNLIMKQRGKADKDFTEFTAHIWDYLKDRLKLNEKVEEAGINFLVSGQSSAKYGWDPRIIEVDEQQEVPITNADGTPVVDEAGTPQTQVLIKKVPVPLLNLPFVRVYSYKDIFYSPEAKFVLDDEDNDIPFVICKRLLTTDQLEEDYSIKAQDDELSKLNLKDIDSSMTSEEDRKQFDETDMDRVEVYEYYGNLPKKFVKNDWSSSYVYYAVFSKKRVLKEPKRIEKKPFLQLGNYGLPTRFWRFGEPKVLRELEQDISLGRSRIMDIRDRQGTKIALPQGAEVDEKALRKAKDFTIMRFIGNQAPQYVSPPPVPETILTALSMSKEDLQMASATLDISRGGMSSTVDTATGQKIFQEATLKRNERKRKKIAEFIRAMAKNLLILCAHNWDVDTFSKITDMEKDEIEGRGFIEMMKLLGNEYDVEIDVETILENKATMSAQAIALYREVKDDPLVNREEVIKEVLKVGFGVKDYERFLSQELTPDELMQTLGNLIEQGIITEEDAQAIVMRYAQVNPPEGQQGATGGVGRPGMKSPTEIVKKSMPGVDANQMQAQAQSAKQFGQPKGSQQFKGGL